MQSCHMASMRSKKKRADVVAAVSPAEEMPASRIKVAVVGGGVSGLAAAWHLHYQDDRYDVQLFESANHLGGHAWTVPVQNKNDGTTTDVDIGFMVCNSDNYPNMMKWFEALNVPMEDSDMSLSVSLDQGQGVEWCSDGLNGLFGQRSQLISPNFYRFIAEMLRFNREAADILMLPDDDPRKHVTTAQYLRDHHYSVAFARSYLLPMMAALWSASMDNVLQFPAAQLVGFLCNHRMLQLFDRPQWKTVAGRSQVYTRKMHEMLGADRVHLSTPVGAVRRSVAAGDAPVYALTATDGKALGSFDQVIFACHPPAAHKMLEAGQHNDPTLLDLLTQLEYADNVIYVHSDPSLMPSRRRCWASWNCLGKSRYIHINLQQSSSNSQASEAMEGAASGFGNKVASNKNVNPDSAHLEGEEGRMKAVYVTYWLNRLQNLNCEQNVFVSLNPHHKPAADSTHHRLMMAHPQFTPTMMQARQQLQQQHQGKHGLWFCGAWAGYGFHEDGCRSGFEVATALTQTPVPWANKALVLPPPNLAATAAQRSFLQQVYEFWTRTVPIAMCRRFIEHFLQQAVQSGCLRLEHASDGTVQSYGNGTPCGVGDPHPVTLRIFDEWFYVMVAMQYDLGLARSYMAGHFVVLPLDQSARYHPVLKPAQSADETDVMIGDPIGLTRLFLLLIGNRDATHTPHRAGRAHGYHNALTNASGLLFAKIGSFFNYIRYKLLMDNSERGGSVKNIHAHYDISNDLFRTFLDKETLMYSSAIYDAVIAPSPHKNGLVFRGSLEEAQWRKLNTLLDRAQVQPNQTLLDIGFGWGGLSLHAARKYGCRVTGITLSVEQKILAEKRVNAAGLQDLITFQVIDYRTFARQVQNRGKFDRVLSCEMIEAVGHEHLTEFFWAVEQVLAKDGILVMEAITTPEARYETYRRSTDFINTIVFPGSCCPSLHALVDAAYRGSTLTLEHVDNIGLHYAQTLAEWRRRFNAKRHVVQHDLGFDDVFVRAWNYYLTYCEAGFFSQTEHCVILAWSRPGCRALAPLSTTASMLGGIGNYEGAVLTESETSSWVQDGIV